MSNQEVMKRNLVNDFQAFIESDKDKYDFLRLYWYKENADPVSFYLSEYFEKVIFDSGVRERVFAGQKKDEEELIVLGLKKQFSAYVAQNADIDLYTIPTTVTVYNSDKQKVVGELKAPIIIADFIRKDEPVGVQLAESEHDVSSVHNQIDLYNRKGNQPEFDEVLSVVFDKLIKEIKERVA